jgi:hypothetical protein
MKPGLLGLRNLHLQNRVWRELAEQPPVSRSRLVSSVADTYTRMSIRSASLVFFLAYAVCAPAAAQEISAEHADAALPTELAEAVRASLAPAAIRVTIGESELEFWWVERLETTSPDWAGVPEGSLVGALRTSSSLRDIRGRTIKPGVYTIRYGIQPANGDHLGVSPHREFLLLSPAGGDTKSQAAGHEGSVALSKVTIGGSHPAILSIDPPAASEPALTIRTNDAGHKAVVFEVPTSAGPLRFGLILVGRIEA